MLTDDRFRHLCSFVRQYLEETAASSEQEWVRRFSRAAEHRWQHTLNVLRNAEKILAGEGADDDVADVVRKDYLWTETGKRCQRMLQRINGWFAFLIRLSVCNPLTPTLDPIFSNSTSRSKSS